MKIPEPCELNPSANSVKGYTKAQMRDYGRENFELALQSDGDYIRAVISERDALRAEVEQYKRTAAVDSKQWHEISHENGLLRAENARQDAEYVDQGFRLIYMKRERDALRSEIERLKAVVADYLLIAKDSVAEITSLRAENTKLREALKEYGRAGIGNSTDWRIQISALQMAAPLIAAPQEKL